MKTLSRVPLLKSFVLITVSGFILFLSYFPLKKSSKLQIKDALLAAEPQALRSWSESRLDSIVANAADFRAANLFFANWQKVYAPSGRFQAVRGSGWRITDSELAGADFRFADLSGAVFQNCNLKGASFFGAFLIGTKFPGSVADDRTGFPFSKQEAIARGVRFE